MTDSLPGAFFYMRGIVRGIVRSIVRAIVRGNLLWSVSQAVHSVIKRTSQSLTRPDMIEQLGQLKSQLKSKKGSVSALC